MVSNTIIIEIHRRMAFPLEKLIFLSICVATSSCGTSAPVNKFSLETFALRQRIIDSHSSDLLSSPIKCPMMIEPSFNSKLLSGYHSEKEKSFEPARFDQVPDHTGYR